jgi:hypothetical protein
MRIIIEGTANLDRKRELATFLMVSLNLKVMQELTNKGIKSDMLTSMSALHSEGVFIMDSLEGDLEAKEYYALQNFLIMDNTILVTCVDSLNDFPRNRFDDAERRHYDNKLDRSSILDTYSAISNTIQRDQL